MPHGRHIKDERKDLDSEAPLSIAAGKTGDAALTPATPQDFQHPRNNTDSHNSHNSHKTQHTRVKQNKFTLYKRTLSPVRNILEGTSHQTLINIDTDVAFLLMGSIDLIKANGI
jgi:hypothetical protein